MTLEQDLDYKWMWFSLEDELEQCHIQNVHSIDPYVVISYMTFIRQIAIFNKKETPHED